MKKTEWITILKKIKTTCQEKLKSEQFRKDTVVLPLLAGLALVMILAAVIALSLIHISLHKVFRSDKGGIACFMQRSM